MKCMNHLRTAHWLIWVAALCLPGMANAEQYVTDGDYTVHYMSMTTADLPANVASGFGLRRSEGTALVMINVQQGGLSGNGVPAQVTGTAKNLVGQSRALEFREVREDEAIYSIATVSVSNSETVTFGVQAVPEGSSRPINLKFKQKFYR